MKQDEIINENMREIIQEYFVKPQLLYSDENEESKEDISERAAGLKKIIQKGFIKYAVVNWDGLNSLLEDDEDMQLLYEAIENRDSKEAAKEVFNNAIEEAKKAIAVDFGLAPRRKKEHEILAEELDDKFGANHINKNINNLISKNIGYSGESDCDDNSC